MEQILQQRHIQIELEYEKKCVALEQCEKALQAKDRSYQHRIQALEDQVDLCIPLIF